MVKLSYLGKFNRQRIYKPGDVIYESSTAGSYNVELLEDGIFNIILVGGGGGGCGLYKTSNYNGSAGGGSAGAISLNYIITKGIYSVIVGSGGSGASYAVTGNTTTYYASNGVSTKFSTYCTAGYGGRGAVKNSALSQVTPIAGAAGTNTITTTPLLINFNYSGKAGSTHTGSTTSNGGSSVYLTYGAGGRADGGTNPNGYAGTSGYIKITCI